ncbi:CO(2)-response secreted protease-like [Neltuma alba]|uniref:CO(2)-response secreted protease-like n=1 Tax=Neltuma alba TaxID=207710 RepID=UPI0010A2CDBC|nr:CO(2)-response secreted protease-like [Prosopis alba]
MERYSPCMILFFLLLSVGARSQNVNDINNRNTDASSVYIVYMGATDSANASLRNDHAQLLSSVVKRNGRALVHNYKHGFSGFAAHLSQEEADSIAKKPGVVSVFKDPVLKLHTTRSWDFLDHQTQVKIDSVSASAASSDTIIGILDTGIWPEAASFSDNDMGPIPSRWKGTCMKAPDFDSSNCNRKLIGARYYKDGNSDEDGTARDTVGHGTHVASTAAGNAVADASYHGLATGSARGGSPASRLAVYRVCSDFGCQGSAILAAFDDAIADAVDVLSLSLGAPYYARPALTSDPIAIGSFHAVERGITVVCSAGNDGPTSNTVSNDAPWILTVAASTLDRDLQSDLVLPDNKVIKGEGINFSNLSKSAVYPLVYGESAKAANADAAAARQCHPDTLDESKVKGKIVICDGKSDDYSTSEKISIVQEAGAVGLVNADDQGRYVASNFGKFPATVISSKDEVTLLQYLNSTSNPLGTILPTVSVNNFKPAPQVAYFSSRGPSTVSKNIIKPDITAPGVEILASWTGDDSEEVPAEGKKASSFNLVSGTSMSCPHVSGVAATVKSRNPAWSPSAIKSAIMTSAIQMNNMKEPITTDSGTVATPYDYGAGEVSTLGSLQPGLVYETTTTDYLNYLCYIGLNISSIKLIAGTVPDGFACPKDSTSDNISNINYPSIAVSNFKGTSKITRTVSNVGEDEETVYTAVVEAPSGVDVKVSPNKLQFTKSSKKLSYEVSFSATASVKEAVFGSITWSNGKYNVRSPFVLTK